jgi:hypothetical protein
MSILLLAVLLGLIPAAIAKGKGYSFGGWWLYGALLFIVALPHALIMSPNLSGIDERAARDGLKKCPFCAEFVRPEALICKHCGKELSQIVAAAPWNVPPPISAPVQVSARRGDSMPAWKWVLAIGVPCLIAWVAWIAWLGARSSTEVRTADDPAAAIATIEPPAPPVSPPIPNAVPIPRPKPAPKTGQPMKIGP